MFKKICSLVLLICMLASSFTGINTVFAVYIEPTQNPPDFSQFIFLVDKSQVELGGSVTFTGSHPNHKNSEIQVSFQTFDQDGYPAYPDECWTYAIGNTSETDGSFSITFTIPESFTPRTYGFEVGFLDNGYCYYPNVELTVTVAATVNKSSLQSAISAANTNKASVAVSVYGSEVEKVNKWVTQQEMTAYESAITSAAGIYAKANASQTEVDQAVTNLGTATTIFNGAKKAGTKEDNQELQLLRINKETVTAGTTVTASVYSAVYAGQTVSVALWKNGEVVYSFKEQSDVFVEVPLNEQGKGQETLLIPSDVPADDYEFRILTFSGDDTEFLDPGVTLQVIEPEINKQALQTAITTANANKASVVVSVDGSEVEPANKWVSQGQMSAYETTIAAAQGIYNKTNATQTEVDQAVASLATATGIFNSAKKAGTKQITYQINFSGGEHGTLSATVDGSAINSGNAVVAGKNVVFTASPGENYRVKQWTTNGTVITGNKTTTLTLSNLQAAKTVTVDFEEIASIGYTVSRQAIVLALEKATNKLTEKFDDSSFNYQKHWMAIAINGFDKTVPGSYLQAIENGDMPAANSGQYGKYILGILAAGGDPTNINGRNLLAELCQLSDMRNVNTEGGIYTTPFGLLALDAVNYEIPVGAGFTRDDLINKLITLASPTGGEDGVGFVLTALGKYYDVKPAVKSAVDSVISAWASRQGVDGGFGAGAWSTSNNVNTAAQVLMGLSFNGKDPQSEQFTKAEGNLVSFILSLQNSDGTFNWQKNDPGSISMATEQAAYALAQYLRQLDGRKNIYDFTGSHDYKITRERIASCLDKATNKLIEKFDDSSFNYQQHWMAIAIKGNDKTVPGSYLQAIENGNMPAANSGQYGKYILGILAAGGDPTNINGRNLLAELCQLSDMRNVNTEGGIYATPFGLLALDAVNYEIPANAGFTRDALINKLITLASPTGGEDGVGFVLTALGKYYNEKPAVKAAVDSVISAWASRQGEDGGFGAGAWSTANNVNTAAQVLMGLSFNGKDPQSEQFTKAKGNLVSFILSLQNADGTFNWQKNDPGSISMATEQAVYALDQYLRQLDGRKSIYDFTSTADDETAPVITTDLEDKTVNASGFSFTASASDAVDGTVETVVKQNGVAIIGTAGAYKVVLSQGSNTVTIAATDLSGNKAEKSCTIIYTPKTRDIPAGDQPKVDIPADSDDYKIGISANDGNKEIKIEIPEDKSSKVIVELPSNSSLPKIEAVKGDVTALIPKGTQVTSGNASGIELITSANVQNSGLKDKVKDIIPDGKALDSIVQAFSMGNGENIEFSNFIILTFKGMQGKEAAYIQNGIVHGIQKYSSDSAGLSSGKNEYAYDSGNDLVVKTKHFTDFIAYTVNTVATPGGGGGTQPQPTKYVTLSVDKLTINEGYVISSTQVELQSGDTAWTLLKRELDKRGKSYKYIWNEGYGSVYVQSIDGDGEFDHGSGSGWMYNVNGWYPNYGATKYTLKDGDKLQWRYTTNLGADLGEDLSKWENPVGTPTTGGQTPVIASGEKTPTIEVPKAIEKDYILNIAKELTNTENVTVNIPEGNAKVILNLEAVKDDLPKLTAVRGNVSLVIDKGTQIKAGNSNIEVLTAIDTNDAKTLELIKNSINSNEKYGKVNSAFVLGNANNTVLFDKPVTLIFKGAKGQSAGFIEENKFTPIEIYETEEKGIQATKDSEKKVYAFIKDNDLYIKTNHFTTFVSYTIETNSIDLKKTYKDESSISTWAYEAIKTATQKGFVGGNNGKFNPKDNITRAEFTKIMVSILGLDIKADKVINFTDVKEDNWFYPYVNAAYKAGIVKGSGSNFNPGDKITREQMAAIIIRALGVQPIKPVTAIKDINDVSDCFKTDVETIFALGLMVGDGAQFNPADLATREMAAVVAMKAYDYRNGEYTKNSEVNKYIEETGALMQKTVSNPVIASVGGEWTVLSLARSGIKVPESYYKKYYGNVEKKLKETSGILHNIKYTEYDRVILALSSIGKDVTNTAGYDLTKPLADFNTLIKQGLNGPIWALIALDSKDYQIPADKNVAVQTTREMLVSYILSKEISGGGWSLTSEAPADTDITAMALQALSKYQDNKDAKAAIDRALNFLSSTQQADGSFKSTWGDETSSESIAQVVVALTSLNIDPGTDKRFIKNGKNAVSALLTFYVTGGGFKHILNGELDAMATDQGMYALVAYDRYVNGHKKLYDMTDVK